MRKLFVISFALLTLIIVCSGQDKKNKAIFPPSVKDKKVEVVKENKSVKPDTMAVANATDTLKGSNSAALSEDSVKIQQLNESIIVYQDSLSILKAALKAKEDEYNKLLTLIDNHMDDTYNSRSHVYITLDDYKGDDVYTFVFNFRMNNMPTSIQNALSERVLSRKFGEYSGIHSSSYINTNICYLEMSVNGMDGDNRSQIGYPDIDTMIGIIKYIIKTIEPIYDDIISFKSENDDIAIALKMNLNK